MIKSPGKVLKLWIKAVKVHEKDKDPKNLPKKGQEQKSTVKKGLTKLRDQAAAGVKTTEAHASFTATRDRVGVALKKYCRYLNAAKDEDKKVLPKFLKLVKQLTAVVLGIEAAQVDLNEDEMDLDSLNAVDVSALEKALAQPDTDADVDFDAAPPPPTAKKPPAPSPASGEDKAFQERLKGLLPRIAQAQQARPELANDLKLGVSQAQVFQRKKDYPQANAVLDRVEGLVKQNGKGAVPPPPARSNENKAAQDRLKNLLPRVLEVQKVRPGLANDLKLGVSKAQVFLGKKDYVQANAVLDRIEGLVKRSGDGAVPPPPQEQAGNNLAGALARWQTERVGVVNQIRKLEAALNKSGHGQRLEAIILLEAIVKNLTPRPDSRASVLSLERYLQTDDIIGEAETPNHFGINLRLREPLLKALADLKPQVK
jgi:hypothetical protein